MFEVKNGSFAYKTGRMILENISMKLEQGEILSVLGPNGIGKTTLLKCMLGFLKWQSGESYLNGKDLEEIPERELWKQIAYVPQAKNSSFSFSVFDMVLIGRNPHIPIYQQPGKKDIEITKQALETVGIYHMKDRLCGQLSGGELQLVLIARALATEPQLIILDEPETGLDLKNQMVVLNMIKDLVRKNNYSAIINTHYPIHALDLSDKTITLSKEGEFYFGKSEDIIDVQNMRKVFGVNVWIDEVVIEDKQYHNLIPLSVADN